MNLNDLFKKIDELEELIKGGAEEYTPVLEKFKAILATVDENDLFKSSPDDENEESSSSAEDDEEDPAAQWLKEKEGAAQKDDDDAGSEKETSATEEKPKRKLSGSEWAPRNDYSDKENTAMKAFMDQGYSHREAERMAGAYKGPSDLWSAMNHSMRPSQPSDKMLAELKELAGHWLKSADKQSRLRAEPEKNPMKFAAGKLGQAHEEKTKSYVDAWHSFLENPGLKHLTPRERHEAVREWKGNWKKKNENFAPDMREVSGEQRHFGEAADVRSKALQEKLDHIFSGGASGGDMDAYEAAQHLGMSSNEEDAGPNVTTFKDPSSDFAARNQDFIDMQNQKRKDAQVPVQQPSPPVQQAAPVKPNPGFTIRKKATPEQLDRFKRVTAAKTAMATTPGKDEEE